MSKDLLDIYDEIAEKKALEVFDSQGEDHVFSKKYIKRKKRFQKKVVKELYPQQLTSQKQALMVAAMVILIPSTVYGAKSLYDWYVEKNNYELDMTLKKVGTEKEEKKYYKLNFKEIPNDMMRENDTLVSRENKKSNMRFNLWRMDEEMNFKELFTESYEEKLINGHKVIFVNKVEDKFDEYSKSAYMLFEEEGVLIQASISNALSNEKINDILQQIDLKEVPKEDSSYIFEKNFELPETNQDEIVKGISEDSKNIFKQGKKIETKVQQNQANISIELKQVDVLSNIKELNQLENFNEKSIERAKTLGMLNEVGELTAYMQEEYEIGDGITSTNKKVGEKQMVPKFVCLTMEVENLSGSMLKDLYIQSPLVYFEKNKEQWNFSKEGKNFTTPQAQTLKLDYADNGSGGYSEFIDLNAHEKKEYKIGFFVDENRLDQLFLPILPFEGEHDMLDLDDDRIWLDVRQ